MGAGGVWDWMVWVAEDAKRAAGARAAMKERIRGRILETDMVVSAEGCVVEGAGQVGGSERSRKVIGDRDAPWNAGIFTS